MNLSPDAASGLPQTHDNARTSHFRPAGVRKHARKTHLAWLKSVDENAGSRDRHLESKPSTYCVKEEGYDFGPEDLDEHELSPQLSPTLMGNLRVCSPDARGQYGSGSLSASPNQSGQTSPTGFALPPLARVTLVDVRAPGEWASPDGKAVSRTCFVCRVCYPY